MYRVYTSHKGRVEKNVAARTRTHAIDKVTSHSAWCIWRWRQKYFHSWTPSHNENIFSFGQDVDEHGSEFYLMDNAVCFISAIQRLADPGFKPTEEDVLRARAQSTSITETRFNMGKEGGSDAWAAIEKKQKEGREAEYRRRAGRENGTGREGGWGGRYESNGTWQRGRAMTEGEPRERTSACAPSLALVLVKIASASQEKERNGRYTPANFSSAVDIVMLKLGSGHRLEAGRHNEKGAAW
ncbi:hypothetical protein B0H11DRAFT_1928185 [Mycena galericulata]|nr:hypothetical protein B0H11DRAFT_1928185 [Mycena galericulata]